MDLVSDVVHCGILTAIVQVEIPERNGLVGLQTKNLACTGQQLIPDPLRWHINKCLCNKRKGGMDLGSDALNIQIAIWVL